MSWFQSLLLCSSGPPSGSHTRFPCLRYTQPIQFVSLPLLVARRVMPILCFQQPPRFVPSILNIKFAPASQLDGADLALAAGREALWSAAPRRRFRLPHVLWRSIDRPLCKAAASCRTPKGGHRGPPLPDSGTARRAPTSRLLISCFWLLSLTRYLSPVTCHCSFVFNNLLASFREFLLLPPAGADRVPSPLPPLPQHSLPANALWSPGVLLV